MFHSEVDAALHELAGEAAAARLLRHRDDAALQDALHLERVEQVQVAVHRVQDVEDLKTDAQ